MLEGSTLLCVRCWGGGKQCWSRGAKPKFAQVQGRAHLPAAEERAEAHVQDMEVGSRWDWVFGYVCVCVEIVAILFYFKRAEALFF